jgi:hypothetical protein
MPAKTGIRGVSQSVSGATRNRTWIPAFAGMTEKRLIDSMILECFASLGSLDVKRIDDEADRAVMADERNRFDELPPA